jgi:chromosome segregation ATPase
MTDFSEIDLTILNEPITNDNFEDADKELMNVCNLFIEKWINIDENKNNDHIVTSYIKDTKYIFELLYKVYGSEELMNELKDEDQEDEDIKNHLQFLSELKIVIDSNNIEDFKNNDSQVSLSLKNCLTYIQKKDKELKELNETMNEFNHTLERLNTTLEVWKTTLDEQKKDLEEITTLAEQ